MIKTNVLDKGSALLTRWQADDDALEELHTLFDAVIAGQFDAVLREQVPADSVSVTTSIHLMTLTLLNQLYGLTSADFYKGDPRRYVRTTLMTQWLLGIRKLTLGWPVYAFGAECLGQVMMYPDQHAPGADPGEPLVNQMNWRELDTPNLEGEIPQIIEEMLLQFADLTGLEPVAHLPGPYSLAADIFGQEALISALLEAPDFVAEFLVHLTDKVIAPWIERLVRLIPNVWIELSDASGSPLFIGPQQFMKTAAPPVQRLINDYPWGTRVFVANYRGEHLVLTAGKRRRRRTADRRGRREEARRPNADETKSNIDLLVELISFKLTLNPNFIIKLDADEVPVSFYVEQAILHDVPLYLGIGATRIDRNSIADHSTARQEIEEIVTEYTQAIKNVSESLARNGKPRSALAWPGDIFIEDTNAESDLELVKTIVKTKTMPMEHL
jgi:hypothetical protein